MQIYEQGTTQAPSPTPNTNTDTTPDTTPDYKPVTKYIRPTIADHSLGEANKDGWYPVGCFQDSASSRALSGSRVVSEDNMTPEACATHCANLGFRYAGVEVCLMLRASEL
jgi:hypothetical protein